MMLQTATNDADNYSANHSPEAVAAAARNAALTMNVGMLLQQNSMARQAESLSPA